MASCNTPEVHRTWPDATTFSYTIEPTDLDFDQVDLGDTATRQLIIRNTGTSQVLVMDLDVDENSGFKLTDLTSATIEPQSSASVTVQWAPVLSGTLNKELHLALAPTPDAAEEVTIPVKGTGMGASLSLNITDYDFGAVSLGCERDVKLTVTNSGNQDLLLNSVNLGGDHTFSLVQPEPLPWVVPPFQSREIKVHFKPEDTLPNGATLNIDSNAGGSWARLVGYGQVDGEEVVDFELAERGGYTTILVHVNEVAIPRFSWSFYSTPFVDSLPDLFQALHDSGNNFRIAFIWNQSGEVSKYDYIDNTFTVRESADAVLDMIDPGALMGDNDRSYITLENGISFNKDWLFETDEWKDAKLNLVAINRDAEQSGGSPPAFIKTAQGWKDDAGLVKYHAIAGPPPSGCGRAESFVIFKTAVDLTGGSFFSICDTDWTDNVKKLVGNMTVGDGTTVQGADAVQLKGTPLVESIRVTVDKRTLPVGWHYDRRANAVVFDNDYVLDGKHVQVRYQQSSVCGG